MANDSGGVRLQSGYDLDVYGLDNGLFLYIHIPALVCITLSLFSVVTAIAMSFRLRPWRKFFSDWSKAERFVVYLALCDGLYNCFHFTDHLHVVILEDHVRPTWLCEVYGFTLVVSISAQNLMVNVIAVNAFMLIHFKKNLEFGECDWRLLLYTFGLPVPGAIVAACLSQLGPNGAFCYFDGVKGVIAKAFFTTVSLTTVLVINVVLYILTWKKIREQTEQLNLSLKTSATMVSSNRAVRNMSLFVLAFFIQWWSMVIYGIWDLATDSVPQALVHCVTTFTNLGGVLNLVVLVVIRKRRKGGISPLAESVSTQKESQIMSHHQYK